MNREWMERNKAVQVQLKQEETFAQGIEALLALRQNMMEALLRMKGELDAAAFCAMPFPKAGGYGCKTVAYSIWHIFRTEDIVANSLIRQEGAVLCAFAEAIGAPIATTGDELAGQQIAAFSEALNLDALYAYALAVQKSTDALLRQLSYGDLHRAFGEADKERLRALRVVGADSGWLIDFWCGKNIRELIQMPFSWHWMMHIEESIRIRDIVCPAKRRKADGG